MAGIVNKVFCLKIFVTGAVVSSAQTWGVLPPPRKFSRATVNCKSRPLR